MAREIQPKTILVYTDKNGNEPYTDWLTDLKDQKIIERIRVRIRRLASGLYGDCEAVGKGVSELRMFFGPGYRVYFGEDKENIIILLCGGDKSSQKQDIKNAKAYWQEYKDNG
ncbi:addiction module killer protein (plasmid) [Thalassoporum mexicanum PCC 7367]|uniref:type II toxin-antitoxin system RelE/ParE family toxin n=1 Tax=Thalassoporum mexicanum TaxID=3457544 RepID=UPI00029F9AB6|nr:type II toxin-antitoxin system RelE/ParE family toxin [Pseudanabaena sp. PCC 7367]AFY71942.1 addiction module killer protein [Pseudanabaena sp. PCC 7367]